LAPAASAAGVSCPQDYQKGSKPDIQCPVLLTRGRGDRVSTVDRAILPMRITPKYEPHIFPECGHWVMIERKMEFESVMLALLRRA